MIIAFLTGVSAYGGGNIEGKIATKTGKMIDNAVIYIDKIPGRTFKAPTKHAQMDQRKLTFIPHILPILVETTVDFLNSDDVLHNVFTPHKCGERFNLGSSPHGVVLSFTFKEPGCSAVMLCSIHPDMEAYIVVLETPYFAVSEKDGSYEINNVPTGKYDLKTWHKLLKGSSLTIQVPEKGVVTADFELTR
jgi:plastocyanin